MRCNASTKDGDRCKNTTVNRFPYCWVHLKSKDKLVVKKSTIPNAGLGLFYVGKKSVPKNKDITSYSGTVSSRPDQSSQYVIQMSKGRYLDAKDKLTAVGRYINHTNKNPNVGFSASYKTASYHGQPAIKVKTKKIIKPNTELLANYGRDYWRK